MIKPDLQNDLSVLMIRASLKGKRGMLEVGEKHDLTMIQVFALCLLKPDESLPMHALSEYLLCEPSNITGVVDRLVEGSYIERKESAEDRRVKVLSLTKQGLQLRSKLLDIAAQSRLPNLSSLSQEEVKKLLSLLEKATGIPL